MKYLTLIAALVVLLPLTLTAQDEGRRRGNRGFDRTRFAGLAVARLADANRDGAVTGEEWKTFLDSVQGKDGNVDVKKLVRSAAQRELDLNGNGTFDVEDLDSAFKALDKDKDGALGEKELRANRRAFGGRRGRGRAGDGERPRRRPGAGEGRGRGQGGDEAGEKGERKGRTARRAARVRVAAALRRVVRSADGNADKTVTAEEWTAFKSEVTDDKGIVDMKKIRARAKKKADGAKKDGEERSGRRGRRGGNRGGMLSRLLDPEGKGSISMEKMSKLFSALDKNADGTLQKEELTPRRRRRGGEEGGRRRPGKDL
ncbi:MAG TPA: hypothetical protein ENK43_14845 [Planctomycetes bacterium]|nr:hypothetical protein [Planctomycetota bacterium]